MQEELVEAAKEYIEVQNRLEEVKKKISELREETFGDESEDTEEKARQMFSEIGSTNGESSETERLDSLREEKKELQEKRTETETALLEKLVDVRFPLNEKIQGSQPPVEFPFSRSIEPDVLDAISEVMGEDVREGEVRIQTKGIVVKTASVDEAIESVEKKVSDIRERADSHLDVPAQVRKIKDRDPKVASMLYVLNESNRDSMTKAEMEDEMGLERGDLRGQLYYVLENDPYIKKQDDGFTLTPNGEKVIERFVNQRGEPEMVAGEAGPDAEGDGQDGEDGEDVDQEEVTAYE
jgi:hypothetical protein